MDLLSHLMSKRRGIFEARSNAWDVYLNGKHIDTVFDQETDAEMVKRSLVDHDGYDPNIEVKMDKTKTVRTFDAPKANEGKVPSPQDNESGIIKKLDNLVDSAFSCHSLESFFSN